MCRQSSEPSWSASEIPVEFERFDNGAVGQIPYWFTGSWHLVRMRITGEWTGILQKKECSDIQSPLH